MGIKISKAQETPAIVHDRIFMNSLNITQFGETRNDAPPKYSLRLEYSIYGVDDNNKRHFLPKVNIIHIDDYLTLASQKALVGDLDLVQAMKAIELAIATVIEDQTDLGTTEVVS